MGTPKIKSSELKKLYSEDASQSLQNKKLIEGYIKRLNELLKDPKQAKKAALILEEWLRKSK